MTIERGAVTPSERDREAGAACWDVLYVTPGVELDGDQCDAAINVVAQAIAQARAEGARAERAAVLGFCHALEWGMNQYDIINWLEAREGEA